MIKIRNYKDSDYEDVITNLKQAYMFNPISDKRETLKRKIKANPGSIIVAEVDNKVVGQQFFIEDQWRGFLFRLSIRKQYRKKGIGSLLIKEAEKRLKRKGVKEIDFYVREHHFPKLKNYYKKLGYHTYKDKRFLLYKRL